MAQGGPQGIDWVAARTEYVTGTESFAAIARRLGVSKKAVEKHGSDRSANDGRTWGELRAEHRAQTAAKAEKAAGDAAAGRMARVRSKAAETAELALDEMLRRIRAGGVTRTVVFAESKFDYLHPIDDKDLIAAAKLAVAVKLEHGGDPDGTPVRIATQLDALSIEELRILAGGEPVTDQ